MIERKDVPRGVDFQLVSRSYKQLLRAFYKTAGSKIGPILVEANTLYDEARNEEGNVVDYGVDYESSRYFLRAKQIRRLVKDLKRITQK